MIGSLDVYKILGTGVIGLGFLLALLAYRLLSQEQKHDVPKKSIIKAVYAFMGFSIVLCLLGGASQFVDKADVAQLKKRAADQKINLERYRQRQEVRLSNNQKWKGILDTAVHFVPGADNKKAISELRDEIALPPVEEIPIKDE